MKTVSELQHEIRLVRKDLTKMDERLSKLDEELTSFKETTQEATTYFDHIFNLAEEMPLLRHPVLYMQPKQKSIYFGLLFMIANLENSISNNQLLLLQRMVIADENRDRIDYYMRHLGRIKPENLFFQLDDEGISIYADQLILDMLIIAKLGEICTEKTWCIISDIASVFQKAKDEFQEICSVAAAVLKQDWCSLHNDVNTVFRLDSKYSYYLNGLTGWKEHVDRMKIKEIVEEINSVVLSTAYYDCVRKSINIGTEGAHF